MDDITQSRREQAEHAADVAAHERAGAVASNIGRQSPGFVRAIHPDHGEAVTYVPGEMLPGWVVDRLDGGQGHYDVQAGVFVLDDPSQAATDDVSAVDDVEPDAATAVLAEFGATPDDAGEGGLDSLAPPPPAPAPKRTRKPRAS